MKAQKIVCSSYECVQAVRPIGSNGTVAWLLERDLAFKNF